MLKKGARNEPLDLWVYGYAAAVYLGMPRWKEHDWQRLAQQVEPPLFEPNASVGSTPAAKGDPEPTPLRNYDKARPRIRRGSFTSRWKL
jgi:phage terminase large subunit GpA-like protein